MRLSQLLSEFLSTPSGWRATVVLVALFPRCFNFYPRPPGGGRLSHSMFPRTAETISIHALRVEGDKIAPFVKHLHYISIHALRVEGDKSIFDRLRRRIRNFYPRPPGGGRHALLCFKITAIQFLSTPSGWRATAKTDKVFVCFCAKGRRICLFKTRKEKICRWRFKKDKFWVLIWCEGNGKSVCALASHCG